MDVTHTVGVIEWKLKATMDSCGVTRYALQKDSGISMNTLRSMYDGSTKRPDLDVIDSIIRSLRRMTGKSISLVDVIDWQE